MTEIHTISKEPFSIEQDKSGIVTIVFSSIPEQEEIDQKIKTIIAVIEKIGRSNPYQLIKLERGEDLEKQLGKLSCLAQIQWLQMLKSNKYNFLEQKLETANTQDSDLYLLIQEFYDNKQIQVSENKKTKIISTVEAFGRTKGHRARFIHPHYFNIASSILKTIETVVEEAKLDKFANLLESSSESSRLRLCDLAGSELEKLAKSQISFSPLQKLSLLQALDNNPKDLPEFVEISEFLHAVFNGHLNGLLDNVERPQGVTKNQHKENLKTQAINFMEQNKEKTSLLLTIMIEKAKEIGVGFIEIDTNENVITKADILKFSTETAFVYHFVKHPISTTTKLSSCEEMCRCKSVPIETLLAVGGKDCQEIKEKMEDYLNAARNNIKNGLISSAPHQIKGETYIFGDKNDPKSPRTFVKWDKNTSFIASFY